MSEIIDSNFLLRIFTDDDYPALVSLKNTAGKVLHSLEIYLSYMG